MSYISNVIASSLSNIRFSCLIYFKHFFLIKERNACQRKITKEEETVSVSSSLDLPSSIIRRAAATGKQW